MPYYFHLPRYYPNFDFELHKAAYLRDNNEIKRCLKSNKVCIYEIVDGYTALGIALAQNYQPTEIIDIYKNDCIAVRDVITDQILVNNELPPILVAFGYDQVKKYKFLSQQRSANNHPLKKLTILLKETNYKCDVIQYEPVNINDILTVVEELLPNGVLDLNPRMKSDKIIVNFLHLAAMNGMKELITQLIDLGANLEVDPRNCKLLPLNLAIGNGQLETVKFLMEKVDFSLFENLEKSLITEAVDVNEYSVFEYLVEFFVSKNQEKYSISRIDALQSLMPDVEKCFHHLEFATAIFNNTDYRNVFDLSKMLHRCALNSTFSNLAMELIKLNLDWLLVESDDNYLRQSVTAFHMIVSQGWPEIEIIYQEYPEAKKILFSNPQAACVAFDYGLSLHQIPENLAVFLFKTHRNEIVEMNLIPQLLSSSIKRSGFTKLIDLLLEFTNTSKDVVNLSEPLLTSLSYRSYDVTERLLNIIKSNDDIINVRDENGNNLLYYTMWETRRRKSRYAMGSCRPPRGTPEEREQKRLQRKLQLNRIAQKLLDIGVEFNHQNNDNETLLHRAVLSGDEKSVENFLALGVSLHLSDKDGITPAHLVLKSDILTQLIEHTSMSTSNNILNVKDQNGDTALHHMVKELDCEPNLLVNAIKYGADVNATNNDQRTPLFYVNSDDCAEILLKHGADPNVRDSNDSMCVAVLDEQNQPTKFIVEHSNLDSSVNKNGHGTLSYFIGFPELFQSPTDKLKELIKAQCNTVDTNGSPMLCVALFQRNENCLKMLLNEPTINVNAKDSLGQSAIHLAYNCPNFIDDLLMKGACVDALDDEGFTPLMHAVKWNSNAATLKFLTSGAQVNIQNVNGDTALHFAARANNFPLIREILNNDGDWRITNEENEIPFDSFVDPALVKIFKNVL